eukprot:1160059-Pelagomonas_calceolata.AAC.3
MVANNKAHAPGFRSAPRAHLLTEVAILVTGIHRHAVPTAAGCASAGWGRIGRAGAQVHSTSGKVRHVQHVHEHLQGAGVCSRCTFELHAFTAFLV